MSILPRLLKVGSMAESLGVYVPAMILQKSIALGRVLLFAYLLTETQYGLWGLGMMIFNIAAPLVTLGSNHGLIRYVSFYEARGQLRRFYQRVRWGVVVCTACLTVAALAGSDLLTRHVIASRPEASQVAYRVQFHICWAALANALIGALYHNMLGFLVGMRAYRLLSAVEVLFAVTFTAVGAITLSMLPTGLALLLAHLGALAVTLGAGTALLHLMINRQAAPAPKPEPPPEEADAAMLPPGAETDEITGELPVSLRPSDAPPPGGLEAVYLRVLRYGLAAVLGTLLWHGTGYLSFWLTSREYGKAAGGVFYVFLLLGQPIVFLANAIWAVIFSHVARLWEAGRRAVALGRLETAYKAVTLMMLTLTVLVYATSPLWVKVLPARYRAGRELIGGLLMFFVVLNHLALMSMLAKLHERPIVVAAATLAGGAANVLLALWWMPARGPAGAAWAAGVGMYAGAGAVALAYLLACRQRLHPSSYAVLLLPAALLLPVGILVPLWAAVMAVAIFSPWLFTRDQKALLASVIARTRKSIRGKQD